MKYLTDLKKDPELTFLNHVSSVALQQSIRNQNKAYDNFFAKRAKFPRVKKRHNRQSLQLMANAFSIKNNEVYIAKSKKPLNITWSKPLNITWSRPMTGKVSSLTISKERSGKYYISFIAEREQKPLPVVNTTCGIDIGLKDLLCFDNGQKIPDMKAYLLYEKLVLRAQRKLSRFDERRKKLGLKVSDRSLKRERLRKKLARLREKITFIKRDYIHKLTTKIINENQVIY
jgi:putative transposase